MTRPVRRPARPLAGAAILVASVVAMLFVGRFVERFAVVDRTILGAIRGAGPAWLRRAAIDLTALGSGTVLTLVVLAAAALLVVRRRPLVAASLVAASWSGGRVVELVKRLVERARPDLADRLVPVTSASFPSAHAANSAIVYLTLAALAAAAMRERAHRRACFVSGLLLIGIIGTTRVYLGVHWPSDVAAGWGFGVAWALGWWWLTARSRASTGMPR